MAAYYNEIDPYAAQWLRNLIVAGRIAPGDVDERDVRDLCPSNLDRYTQCHFFAGIGIWSLSLRSAGWPDDRPVWTGSCPCQPFSAAGRGLGVSDERHLFPHWHHLIEQCRPETVLGEQVASADGLGWFDTVSAKMEATGYAIGAIDTCAAGFGSYHIRQRLYFAAHDLQPASSGLGNAKHQRLERLRRDGRDGEKSRRIAAQSFGPATTSGHLSGLADAHGRHTSTERQQRSGQQRQYAQDDGSGDPALWACPPDGYWQPADWLRCRDDKWRPVGPGTFPLAHENTSRMGRLRAYGNALDAAQATNFIRAYLGRNMETSTPIIAGNLFEWSA